MSNCFEYKDSMVFHPGYYIKELVEFSGLTQEDFAKRLGTTPKNLSKLIHGEQSLSIDIAMRLSRFTGASIDYWLNLQRIYDSAIAKIQSDAELEAERDVLKVVEYKYFKEHFKLQEFKRQIDEQVKELRQFLNISSLTLLKHRDLTVKFRSSVSNISESNIIKANAMVQIASVQALKARAPKYNKEEFEKAISFALTQTRNHGNFYHSVRQAFFNAGVVFEILPNLPGSKINGASKKIGDSIMLMVNDRNSYADSFWFSLFHEIGHIKNNDFGVSFEKESGKQEEIADRFAEDCLIPANSYKEFIDNDDIDIKSIRRFSEQIDRDIGIVIGRLQSDGLIDFNDWSYNKFKQQYKITTMVEES